MTSTDDYVCKLKLHLHDELSFILAPTTSVSCRVGSGPTETSNASERRSGGVRSYGVGAFVAAATLRSRTTPSAQKSVSCVARQKARGPGSEVGRGAWRAQIPACAHHDMGMSPRLTGFSPPSGWRQKTQSAHRDPIDSGPAATPSPHHSRLCVCGKCAASSGRCDGSAPDGGTYPRFLSAYARRRSPRSSAVARARCSWLCLGNIRDQLHRVRRQIGGRRRGSALRAQPPPRASIKPMSASSSRVCRAIVWRSATRASLCAVATSRKERCAGAVQCQRQFRRLASRFRRGLGLTQFLGQPAQRREIVLDFLDRAQHGGAVILRRLGEFRLGDIQFRLPEAGVEKRKVKRWTDGPEPICWIEQSKPVLGSAHCEERNLGKKFARAEPTP